MRSFLLAGRAAVEFVADLLAEPDPELLPLRDLDEGGHGGPAPSEPGDRRAHWTGFPGRHYPQFEPPVIRARLGESLDPLAVASYPQWIGDAFLSQDLQKIGKTPAEALPRMRHHGDGSQWA